MEKIRCCKFAGSANDSTRCVGNEGSCGIPGPIRKGKSSQESHLRNQRILSNLLAENWSTIRQLDLFPFFPTCNVYSNMDQSDKILQLRNSKFGSPTKSSSSAGKLMTLMTFVLCEMFPIVIVVPFIAGKYSILFLKNLLKIRKI